MSDEKKPVEDSPQAYWQAADPEGCGRNGKRRASCAVACAFNDPRHLWQTTVEDQDRSFPGRKAVVLRSKSYQGISGIFQFSHNDENRLPTKNHCLHLKQSLLDTETPYLSSKSHTICGECLGQNVSEPGFPQRSTEKRLWAQNSPFWPQGACQLYSKFVDKMSQGPAQGGPFPENPYHVWVRESPKTGMGGFCL